jgi:catalase (peroxidase I)
VPYLLSGEVDLTKTDLMGPDGCISNTADNAGLLVAPSHVATTFENIWQKYCDTISRADFWALLGKIVVEKADPTHTINIPYQYGRRDNAQCAAGAGRLPNAQLGATMLQQVFVTQMGLTLSDAGMVGWDDSAGRDPPLFTLPAVFLYTVTLIGAHTLGHVHTAASGYGVAPSNPPRLDDNAWDSTPAAFDNKYYQALVNLPVSIVWTLYLSVQHSLLMPRPV